MSTFQAYAARTPAGKFEPYEFDPGPLRSDEVEIAVESCGICHSDLSMLDNDWGMTQYPFVGGHEAIGRVVAVGDAVLNLREGDLVGLGWSCRSCMHCDQCVSGDQNLCPQVEGTITHQAGAFADRVRSHWAWAIPIPEGVDAAKAGPMLCGGITVFNPLLELSISPTSRVAVVGIGGLGHMALMFCDAWGCEVTAISRSRSKEADARRMGADDFIATQEDPNLEQARGRFDLILNTTNVSLPWDSYIAALAPKGTLHTVGAAPKIEATVFPMIGGQKSLSSSPTGGVAALRTMFDFAARHGIAPVIEEFPMDRINDAFDRLRNDSPPHRLVLKR